MQHGVAVDTIATIVRFDQIAERNPRTDVAPSDVAWHDCHMLGLFHHCVVDGVFRHLQEAGLGQGNFGAGLDQLGVRAVQTRTYRADQARAMTIHLRKDRARAETEHARVPQEAAGLEIRNRLRLGRLLDESTHDISIVFDVPEPGLRSIRTNAKRHQVASFRKDNGFFDGIV
jgi:hypothetical protein